MARFERKDATKLVLPLGGIQKVASQEMALKSHGSKSVSRLARTTEGSLAQAIVARGHGIAHASLAGRSSVTPKAISGRMATIQSRGELKSTAPISAMAVASTEPMAAFITPKTHSQWTPSHLYLAPFGIHKPAADHLEGTTVPMPTVSTAASVLGGRRLPVVPTHNGILEQEKMIPDEKRKTSLKGEALVRFFKNGATFEELPVPLGHFDDDLCYLFRETGDCRHAHQCLWRHYDFRFGMDHLTQYIKLTLFRRLQRVSKVTHESRHFEASHGGFTLSRTPPPHPTSTLPLEETISTLAVPPYAARAADYHSTHAADFHSTHATNFHSTRGCRRRAFAKRVPSAHWKKLIASRLETQKLEATSAKKGVTKERIRELLDAHFDICWDYNSAEGCTRDSGRCRWRHHKLVLAVAGDGAEYKITVGHPTRVGFNVVVTVRPTGGRSHVSYAKKRYSKKRKAVRK